MEWQCDPNSPIGARFRSHWASLGAGSRHPTRTRRASRSCKILPTEGQRRRHRRPVRVRESGHGKRRGAGPRGVVARSHRRTPDARRSRRPRRVVDTVAREDIADRRPVGRRLARSRAASGSNPSSSPCSCPTAPARFSCRRRSRPAGVGRVAIFIRDWDRDGIPISSCWTAPRSRYSTTEADGTFEPPVDCPVLFPTVAGMSVVMEDFNHDGLMDFAFNGNPIRVVLRQSECGFAPFAAYDVPVPTAVPQTMGDLAAGGGVPLMRAADMNGDGQLDLVVTFDVRLQHAAGPRAAGGWSRPLRGRGHLLAVLFGKPDGTFQLQPTVVSLGSSDHHRPGRGRGLGRPAPRRGRLHSDGPDEAPGRTPASETEARVRRCPPAGADGARACVRATPLAPREPDAAAAGRARASTRGCRCPRRSWPRGCTR